MPRTCSMQTMLVLRVCLFLSISLMEFNFLGGEVSFAQPVSETKTFVGVVTASALSDRGVLVNTPFTGDSNSNSSCKFELASSQDGPYSAENAYSQFLAGKPDWRTNFFLGLTPGRWFVRVTYLDDDGVVGPNPQIVEVTTAATSSNAVSIGQAAAVVNDAEISVSVPISGDRNFNSTGIVDIAESAIGPWTRRCDSMTIAPKRCRVRSLPSEKDVYLRVVIGDIDGIGDGTATQIIGPIRYTGATNLAYGKRVLADPGFGCCTNPQSLTDGKIQAANWINGYAWRGGADRHGGTEGGWKSATIDLEKAVPLNNVSIFYHDAQNRPGSWKILVSQDGQSFTEIFSKTSLSNRTASPGTWYYPGLFDSASFKTVDARFIKFLFDDRTLFDRLHGWAVEIEAHHFVSQSQLLSNNTDPLLLRTDLPNGTAEFFGVRNSAGLPATITAAIVTDASGQRSQYRFDAEGRPDQILAFNNTLFHLDWQSNTEATVTAVTSEGALVIKPLKLESTVVPNIAQPAQPASASLEFAGVSNLAIVKLLRSGDSVTDAAVTMIAHTSNGEVKLPGKFNSASNSYEVAIPLPNQSTAVSTRDLCNSTTQSTQVFQQTTAPILNQVSVQLASAFASTTNQVISVGVESAVVKGLELLRNGAASLACGNSQPVNRMLSATSTMSMDLLVNNVLQQTFTNIPVTGPFPNVTVNLPLVCSYKLSEYKKVIAALDYVGMVNVAAPNGCRWSAITDALWIGITGGNSQGNGTVSFTVQKNDDVLPRSGKIKVADQTLEIFQAGKSDSSTPACTYKLSASSARIGSDGGQIRVTVTASKDSCNWGIIPSASWLKATPEKSGSGIVVITVDPNPSTSARSSVLTIAGQSFTVTQDGVTCSFKLSASTANVGSNAAQGNLNVTASASACSWTATSNAAWLRVPSGTNTGTKAVTYTVDQNTNSTPRSGTLTIAGQPFTVTQAGACSYVLSSAAVSIGSGGIRGSVNVSAASSCQWTAASDSPTWLKIVAGNSGNGNGSVTWEASPNTRTSSRTGRLTIANQVFTVTQAGLSCTYSVTPLSARLKGAGQSSANVYAPAGCAWTATTNDSWLRIVSGSSGNGNGSVVYEYGANSSTSARFGSLRIANNTLNVTQDGFTCSFTLSPPSASIGSSAGRHSVNVYANASNCSWSASSNAAWIGIISGGGTGNGSVTYQVSSNTSAFSRTGTLSIAGKSFTVTQAGK